MANDPVNRPGTAGFDVFALSQTVKAIDERVDEVEASPPSGGGFPPIAAKGDWNPQQAVAGNSYIFTCGSSGRVLNLPDPPNDGDEVGFYRTCQSCGNVQIDGGTTLIEGTSATCSVTQENVKTSACVLRYSAARDLWEVVQGRGTVSFF